MAFGPLGGIVGGPDEAPGPEGARLYKSSKIEQQIKIIENY